MKYVYVVTRILSNNRHGIPNLGVHSSFVKAKRHYDSVLQDRIKSKPGIVASMSGWMKSRELFDGERFMVIYLCSYPDEELRLEKWGVK